MELKNNFSLKVNDNNNNSPPFLVGGHFTLSNDNVHYPNLTKNYEQNKGVQ